MSWRSLGGCSPWGREESDTTERLHFHFSLCCIGEGNVSPLQCSCLEDPRDGGAWWAAIHGVAQGRTQLKRLSSRSAIHTEVAKIYSVCVLSHFSHVWLFETLWTVACQAPLSMRVSGQEYWSELPCPPPEDLHNPGVKPTSPSSSALQADSLLLSHWGSPRFTSYQE